MTALLPELAAALPPDLQLDGELVALDDNGAPVLRRLGGRMLLGDETVPVTLFAFDLLGVEGCR